MKNSLRNRRRSVLTIASVAASLCLLGVLAAIYRVLFFGGASTPAQALRLITHHKVSLAQPLPIAYVQQIRQTPHHEAQKLSSVAFPLKSASDTGSPLIPL